MHFEGALCVLAAQIADRPDRHFLPRLRALFADGFSRTNRPPFVCDASGPPFPSKPFSRRHFRRSAALRRCSGRA